MGKFSTLFRLTAILLALPFVATAAVGASQWIADTTPVGISVDSEAITKASIKTRGHIVALNSLGDLEGRLGVLSDVETDFSKINVALVKLGKVVATAQPLNDGSFTFANVTEGSYSLIASGESAFAAYGVHVVGEGTKDASRVMELALVAPNADEIRNLISPQEAAVVSQATPDLNSIPVGANRVLLDAGVLTGSVHPLFASSSTKATVHLLKGTNKLASVETDEEGKFEIADVEPGVYSFVAVGQAGFAAISFEAVGPSEDVDPGNRGLLGPAPENVVYQEYSQDDELEVVTTGSYQYYDSLNPVEYVYEPMYVTEFAPIEYVTESVGYGGAYGGTVGSTGSVAPLLGGRGGLGGIGGGARLGRLGRLAILGGTVVGIVALADGGNNPDAATNAVPE